MSNMPIIEGPIADPLPGGLQRRAGCYPPHSPMRLDGHRDWSLDRCHNSRWEISIRRTEHFTDDAPNYAEPSFMELCSEHPIRAVRPPSFAPYAELCRHHYGHVRIGHDGYLEGVFCCDSRAESNMQHLSITESHVKRPETEGNQEPSYFWFSGPYEAPMWTEAHYHAPRRLCGGIG